MFKKISWRGIEDAVRLRRDPDAEAAIAIAWGPDWPVAVKITNARPAENFGGKEK
jgi:hypothetical protein